MNKDMFKKLQDERPLTADEALALDQMLEQQSSQQVAHMVAAQADESPSMAWRSELNQKLSNNKQSKRKSLIWGLSATVSVGAVATTILLMMLNQPLTVDPGATNTVAENTLSTRTLEDAVLEDHEAAMTQVSLGAYSPFEESPDF